MHTNLNQPAPNTTGFGSLPTSAFPFPDFQYMTYNTNVGFANYNSATISVKKRLSNGLQFQSSYIYARDLSNVDGAATTTADQFSGEFGGTISDPQAPGLDYGNVAYTRRNRFLTTFLYELPFGKGKLLLNSAKWIGGPGGGWMGTERVLLFQSGPFMSVATISDPCGCGYNAFNANGGQGGCRSRRQFLRRPINQPVDQPQRICRSG